MKITKDKYDECYEITFLNDKLYLGIVLEQDYGYVVWHTNAIEEVNSMSLPDEVFEMFKDEYKIRRPVIVLPAMEDIEPLPWEE